jgi:hypothetical protein
LRRAVVSAAGRRLRSGRSGERGRGGNLTVNLVDPTTMYLDHVNTTDMRIARTFRVGRNRVQAFVEIFNVVNASTILSVNETYGQQWLRPLLVMQGRRFQFGGQLDF